MYRTSSFWLLLLLLSVLSVIPGSRANNNNNALYQCGVRNRAGSPLISDGEPAAVGDWPWHAALFINGEHICGGTLFDQRHLLTAAHCVSRHYQNEAIHPDEVEVHLGKHDLNDSSTVQVVGVSEVHVYPKFGPNSPRIDIALLVLNVDVVFSDYVIPICLDRKEGLSIAKLEGQQSWIAGWGVTKNRSRSVRLMSAQLLVARSDKCAMQHPWYVAQLLSEGMFCAQGQNGSSFRACDNGGGIYINEGHRWILRGIKVLSQVDIFSKSVLFTNMQHYLGWIRRLISAADIANVLTDLQANDLYQCGVRKRVGVQLIHHGWTAELGQWPWHAGLHHYTRRGSRREYKCGATLLDQRHVLTSAHCVTRNSGSAMDADKLGIHLGQYDLMDLLGVLVVNVSEVHVHPEFSTNRNDIAVLVLESEVAYSDYVIPICLDEETADGDISKYVGQRGSVAGWGRTEQGNVARLLRTAQMPIVDHVQCVQADPNLFGRYFDKGMFCAGERNGSSVCQGDSGGGLYINEGDRWVLKGVVSFSGLDRNLTCDTLNFAGFANVPHYLDWIRNFTSTKDGVPRKPISRRKSESACNQYKTLARKRNNGVCWNSRHQHSVGIVNELHQIVCSGLLVSNKFVITPCHCIWDATPKSIRMGFSDSIDIESALCHPDYKSSTSENDVALLELVSEIELTATLIPACLASNWTENVYDTLLLTGFFSSSESKQIDFMESVDNKWITDEECHRKAPAFGKLENGTHLCVISPSRELENSKGVSGSALQTYNTRNCMHTVLGLLNSVVSDDTVAIYSRVSRVLDWVEGIIWGDVRETSTTTAAASGVDVGKSNFEEVIDNLDFVFPDQLKQMYNAMRQG